VTDLAGTILIDHYSLLAWQCQGGHCGL